MMSDNNNNNKNKWKSKIVHERTTKQKLIYTEESDLDIDTGFLLHNSNINNLILNNNNNNIDNLIDTHNINNEIPSTSMIKSNSLLQHIDSSKHQLNDTLSDDFDLDIPSSPEFESLIYL